MAKNTIFELNGKAYDALSGAPLGDSSRVAHTVHVQHMPVKQPTSGSLDGMIASSQQRARHLAPTKHVSAHRPQPTKTLMRHAVKPPRPTTLQPTKAAAASGLQPQTGLTPKATAHPTITPKLSTASIDPTRAHRARIVNRSQAVQHFQPARSAVNSAGPAIQTGRHSQTAPTAIPQQPITQNPPSTGQYPHRTRRQASANRSAFTITSLHPPASQQDDDTDFDLFTQALAAAHSHEEPAPHESTGQVIKRKSKKGRRILAVTASLAVFIALCGFTAFQNRDQIQLEMASAKAGFAASMPLYMPQGYDMGKLSYATGAVATSYTHPTQTPFTIMQKKSNWDSQTLLENFVATSDEEYRGFQSNGRTVYVYGKGKATWVNGGIWYQIKNADNLTDEQLVRIAASM